MQSAFGIEHGEISKGKIVKVPKARGMPGGKKPTKAQVRTQGTNPNAPTRPQRFKGMLHRIGEADVSLKGLGGASGRAFKGTGRFLESHPGLTGTALVGGGGAATYSALSQKEPRKRNR